MTWDLNLSLSIVLGTILSLFFVSNKQGLKLLTAYLICFIYLKFNLNHFIYAAPLLILLIVLLNEVEIRGSLILAVGLLTSSVVYAIVSLARAYNPTPVAPDMFFIRDFISVAVFISGLLYLILKHRDYPLAFTMIAFSIFFYSWANSIAPFIYLRTISLPFAALSLLPYLGMTIINNHFEGSLAHIYLTKALRVIAKRLKVDSDSKYAGLVLQVLKLR